MLPHRASRTPRAHVLLLLLLACASPGVLALTETANRAAPAVAGAGPVAAAKHKGHWGWWGGHWGGQGPSRPTPPPTNLDDPEGKACLWTPGVLEYSNAPPNVTLVLQEPDLYFQQGGCAAAVLKDYPREVAACRACHAATTRRACLALQADKELNALSMTCMWRGPQPRANTRHHSQPKAKTLEARWSVGINDPSGFMYRLADDTCFVTADLEADAQSAALYQARLDWILLGPARTPEGNTPAGLNNEALCTIYGNKRKCSLTVPRAGWSKMIWMTNMITTKNPAVIANLATISGTCYDAPYYEQNCATAYSFKYTMRLTEHPCKRGTSPRFAAVSHGSLFMHNYATTLQPGKERLNGDVVPLAWLPLLAGKAARWSLSWGRNPALSSVVALVNTTDIFSKVCAQDSKLPDLFNCNMNNLKPFTIGGRWCTKRTCADQILSIPQLNDYSIVFSPYTSFVWNFTDWRFAYNPSQTPPAEVTYNEIKVWG